VLFDLLKTIAEVMRFHLKEFGTVIQLDYQFTIKITKEQKSTRTGRRCDRASV
jgi:hypothetical protein